MRQYRVSSLVEVKNEVKRMQLKLKNRKPYSEAEVDRGLKDLCEDIGIMLQNPKWRRLKQGILIDISDTIKNSHSFWN